MKHLTHCYCLHRLPYHVFVMERIQNTTIEEMKVKLDTLMPGSISENFTISKKIFSIYCDTFLNEFQYINYMYIIHFQHFQ